MPLFDMGQSATNIGIQAFHNIRDRKWQEKQTDKQYQRDIDQRDYANWYNSPKNQMARFQEAGLNPHLIYGKGTSGIQTSNPKASKPERFGSIPNISTVDPLDEIGKYAGIRKLNAETDLVSATLHSQNLKNQITSETMSAQIQYEIERVKNLIKKTDNEVQKGLYIQQLKNLTIQKAAFEEERAKMLQSGITTSDPLWLRSGWQGIKNFGRKFLNKYQEHGGVLPKINYNNKN